MSDELIDPEYGEQATELWIEWAQAKIEKQKAELAALKAAIRWINSHAYIEGDLDSYCQGVIDEAEDSSSDTDKAHAQTLLKVLEGRE